MAKRYVYHCTTGNYLDNSKRFFNSVKSALDHIKNMIDHKKAWVNDKYILKSFKVTKIDIKELPEYKRIFKVFRGIKPVTPPTLSEMGKRHPKRKAIRP